MSRVKKKELRLASRNSFLCSDSNNDKLYSEQLINIQLEQMISILSVYRLHLSHNQATACSSCTDS